MMELTKEFMQDIIKGRGFGVAPSAVEEMARQLLAGMEQEPVAWMITDIETGERIIRRDRSDIEGPCQPLYAAPQLPQPVVPECYQRLLKHAYGMTMGRDWNKGTMAGHHREKLCKAVEDCREAIFKHSAPFIVTSDHRMMEMPAPHDIDAVAAMLQGAEPVSKPDELPDGWAAVPVEPTEDMIIAGFEAELREEFRDPEAWEAFEAMSGCEQAALRAKWCWAAMIAAAPQQEAE